MQPTKVLHRHCGICGKEYFWLWKEKDNPLATCTNCGRTYPVAEIIPEYAKGSAE